MFEQMHFSAAQLLAIILIAATVAIVGVRLGIDWLQRRNAKHERAPTAPSVNNWPSNAGISFPIGSGTTFEPTRRARTARSELRSRPQ
jgi:hypothetical protein